MDRLNKSAIREDVENTRNESYPDPWKHCIIHLNPETGDLHSDGDHSVRHWIEENITVKPVFNWEKEQYGYHSCSYGDYVLSLENESMLNGNIDEFDHEAWKYTVSLNGEKHSPIESYLSTFGDAKFIAEAIVCREIMGSK